MKLLLVDDEEDIRLIGKMGLEMGGFTVTTADSVESALESARKETPDVILADWLMPGRDGTELLEAVKSSEGLDRVPFIFLTAKAEAGDADRLAQMGAAGAIAKPFDPSAIAEEVKRIIQKARG